MLPLLISRQPWWIGFIYRKTKMVDLEVPSNLEVWLQETSLFVDDEPIDSSINIDDFLSSEKANSKVGQTLLSSSDLDWFDEKIDLSLLADPDDLLVHRNETKSSMEDETADIIGWLNGNFNSPQFDILPSDVADLAKQLDLHNFDPEPAAPSDIFDSHLASPRCNTLQVNSPSFFPASPYSDFPSQSSASPAYSDISDTPDESLPSDVFQTQATSTVDFTTKFVSKTVDDDHGTSQIPISVCEDVVVSSTPSSDLSVTTTDDSYRTARKRKCVSSEGQTPKVKVTILERSIPSTPRPKDRRERKKVQNKEAAARYRIKKRMEEQVLLDEAAGLEEKQVELKKQHDDLKSEIQYLKKLMCEILVKTGKMK